MRTRVERRTVNLSVYPDLVVIYLGMRVNRIAGIKTLLGFGPKISSSAAAQPDGLLRHETIIYSLFPMHVGMRQAVVAELFERFRRNRILARNVFSARGHRGCLRRCTGKHRLNGVRTSRTGSRTDVWRSSEGRKGIWRATRIVRGRALRG